MRRAAIGRALAIGLALALAIASAATIAIHEHARSEWESERARLGTDGYDAARSDAAWDEARGWRTIAERVAIAGALTLLLASALAPASAPASASASASASALLLSTLLDTTTTATALIATRALPLESALGDALAWWLPALVLAAHTALLARGATLGMRIARLRITPPSPTRALLAAVLTPCLASALPVLAIAWLAGRRSPAWLAPHLAAAGVRI